MILPVILFAAFSHQSHHAHALSAAIRVRDGHASAGNMDDPAWRMWMAPKGAIQIPDVEEDDWACRENILGADNAFILRNAAPVEACKELVSLAESAGFSDPGGGARRNGAISWVLDEQTQASLFSRVSFLLPRRITTYRHSRGSATPGNDGSPGSWVRRADGAPEGTYTVTGLNQRCRIYRYRAGSKDEFTSHIDEVWPGTSLTTSAEDGEAELNYDGWRYGEKEDQPWTYEAEDRVSQLTFLLYLTTHKEGEGGETVLLPDDGGEIRVSPNAGDALVFGQSFRLGRRRVRDSQFSLTHEGAPILQGGETKYVLRSDVLYSIPARR